MLRPAVLLLALASSSVAALAGCTGGSSSETAAPAPSGESAESAESAAQQRAFEQPPAAPPSGATPPAAPPQGAPVERVAFDPAHPSVAGITWTAPAGYTFRAPASEMRLAEYVVGRVGEDDVALTVFHFPGMGGSIDANLQRWIGQFTQTDGSSTLAVTRTATSPVNGIPVTTIETRGHFEGGTMGGGNGDDYRLLGAIAAAPGGPVFFKLVGPRAVVDAAEPGFRTLVASFAAAR